MAKRRKKTTSTRRTSSTSNVNTHKKAVTFISAEVGLPRCEVENIITGFFSYHGMKYFICKMIPVKIHGFGKIYWHKSTLKKQARIEKLALEYNMNLKQRLYKSRKSGKITDKTRELLRKSKKGRRV